MKKIKIFMYISILVGYLFWPLTLIKKVKNDLLPIVRMLNKLFTNSPLYVFFAFFYPMIFIGILGSVASPHYMIIGIASLIPIIVGLQAMPLVILNLKQSSVLKRIGATETKTRDITIVFIFYFTIVSIIATIINFFMGLAIYSSKIHTEDFKVVEIMLAFFFGILVGLSMGIFVSGLIKNAQVALLVGIVLTVPGAFLSAEFLPPTMIQGWGPVKYFAFITPQKIATVFLHTATNSHSMFDVSDVVSPNYDRISSINVILDNLDPKFNAVKPQLEQLKLYTHTTIVSKEELIMAWTLLPIEIIGFTTAAAFTFKWGTRW